MFAAPPQSDFIFMGRLHLGTIVIEILCTDGYIPILCFQSERMCPLGMDADVTLWDGSYDPASLHLLILVIHCRIRRQSTITATENEYVQVRISELEGAPT